jgi:twitching motility protein PilT
VSPVSPVAAPAQPQEAIAPAPEPDVVRTSAPAASSVRPSVRTLIGAMLDFGHGISDLVFSPFRAPQVEMQGDLVPVIVDGLSMLKPADTEWLAQELSAGNEVAIEGLKKNGSCDLSYTIAGRSRFRVNIFRQRGTYAIVMGGG